MILKWTRNILHLDRRQIHKFKYNIITALDVGENIVVILDGPKVDIDGAPELVNEMNRNVYGLDQHGSIKWRIASHGSAGKGSYNYCNPFLDVAEWGDAVILYTGDGANVRLDPDTGSSTSMSVSERDRLIEIANKERKIRFSSRDHSQIEPDDLLDTEKPERLEWREYALYLNRKKIHQFPYPVREALDVGGNIVVVLDGPKVDRDAPPELVNEMNRNVYGVDRDGALKWRITSRGVTSKYNPRYCDPILSVMEWGDRIVLTGPGGTMIIDPETGVYTQLTLTESAALLKTAKERGLVRYPLKDHVLV